jgi:hypothetical protein
MGRPKKQREQNPVNATMIDDDLPFYDVPPVADELKSTLEKNPHILCVWMNEEGTWHFCEKPGFKAYSRTDIFNG